MKKPISYMQTNPAWKNVDYSAKGEKTTIGLSGCGPSCMAMVIATLKNANVTPIATCAWSLVNGYKAPNQGTYYTYFTPQGKVYDIGVSRVNLSSIYGQKTDDAQKAHAQALKAVQDGNWVICCMGKGNWTSSGHFILWYGYENGTVYINDPNSTKSSRTSAALSLLQSQVKYYFIVEVPGNTNEVTAYVEKIAKTVPVSNKPELVSELMQHYKGSCWYVIDKLLSLSTHSDSLAEGKRDIYRRTLEAIHLDSPADYNKELLSLGNLNESSIFWVIKKRLDQLGVE